MRLVTVGDNITDCYPDAGLMFPGGNCANVAVHAARAGAASAYIGVVGRDSRGEQLRKAMTTEGVDLSQMRTQSGRTGFATILHVDGERTFGPYDRGVARFDLAPSDLEFVTGFDIAHSSYSARLENDLAAVAERVPLSFDFDAHTADSYAEALIGYVTHAFFSAAHLTETEAEDVLYWACSNGARTALATRGAGGALFHDGKKVTRQRAERAHVEDTLGAGDAFIGYALTGVMSGASPSNFLPRAARAAGAVCSVLGAFGHPVAISAALSLSKDTLHLSKEPS